MPGHVGQAGYCIYGGGSHDTTSLEGTDVEWAWRLAGGGAEDEVARKLLMLAEGECWGLGPLQAAQKYGYSKQRYFQLRGVYEQGGSAALESEKRGPKRNYRRTDEVVRQVIRYRFLDPESSPEVIAQKLVQSGWTISIRSVTRVLADYGLQKKLHRFRPRAEGGSVEARISSESGPAGRPRSTEH